MLAIFALFAACKDPLSDDPVASVFTVTFDKNHSDSNPSEYAEASPRTKKVTSPATTVGALPTAPTRNGYHFVNWNTNTTGDGAEFTATTKVTKNITVYAQWKQVGTQYTIDFDTTGNVTGDSVAASPQSAEAGETITINYTLVGGYLNNRLVFSGVEAAINEVNGAETGTRTYVVSAGDADSNNNTITIIATFTHTNKNLDTIAFTESAIHKTYGDTFVAITVSNSGQGTGEITYSSSHPDIATVDASTGQVTIVKAGTVTITATKAEDETYAGATASYALHIDPVQLTISGTDVTKTKPYDGNTTATVTTDGALGGVISSDTVTVSASAAYNSANVLDANKITVTYTISGANAGGYTAPVALEITDGVSIAKAAGATLSGTVTQTAITSGSITISAITAPSGGQVEYAISTSSTAPSSGWQEGTVFSGLIGGKNYYVFARAKGDDNHEAGTAISGSFTTLAPPVPPTVVDFEDDALAKTYKTTSSNGTGNATVTVVANPVASGEKSLSVSSTSWNRGAYVPINLPFAVENYQSFSFRVYLSSGTLSNPIYVYLGATDGIFGNNDFGNSSHSNYLLGTVPQANVSPASQWLDFEIPITDPGNNIKNLQGNIFLAIGTNNQNSITLLFDDLTFNIKGDFVPSSSISPATATFVKATTSALYADIPVAMTLYGNELSSIKNGETTISPSSTTYTVSGNTVELKKEYLAQQAVGDLTLTFVFNQGGNSNMVIKIVAADADLLITSYDFSTDPNARYTPSTPSGGSIVWTSGKLTVDTGSNYPGSMVALQFKLGAGAKLTNFSKIRVDIVGVEGDLGGGKQFSINVPASGSTITADNNNNTANQKIVSNQGLTINTSGPGETDFTIPTTLTNTASEIEIGFYFNTNRIKYEIRSVKLIE